MVIKVVQYTFFSYTLPRNKADSQRQSPQTLFLKLSFMGTQLTHAFEMFMAASL